MLNLVLLYNRIESKPKITVNVQHVGNYIFNLKTKPHFDIREFYFLFMTISNGLIEQPFSK